MISVALLNGKLNISHTNCKLTNNIKLVDNTNAILPQGCKHKLTVRFAVGTFVLATLLIACVG